MENPIETMQQIAEDECKRLANNALKMMAVRLDSLKQAVDREEWKSVLDVLSSSKFCSESYELQLTAAHSQLLAIKAIKED